MRLMKKISGCLIIPVLFYMVSLCCENYSVEEHLFLVFRRVKEAVFDEIVSAPIKPGNLFQSYVWGGHWIREFKGLTDEELREAGIQPGQVIAESWEISAVPDETKAGKLVRQESIIAGRDVRMNELTEKRGQEVLGQPIMAKFGKRLPILIKFLDCNNFLSIQSHPTTRDPDPAKTEAWVILDAEPGAKIYLGFKEDITREQLEAKLRELKTTGVAFDDSDPTRGRILINEVALKQQEAILSTFLNAIEVRKGDVFLVPEGTIHALGPGIKVAEIQQTSGITYRFFDYNSERKTDPEKVITTVSLQGHKPADFRTAEGILDITTPGIYPLMPDDAFKKFGLNAFDYFTFDLVVVDETGLELDTRGVENGGFHILTALEGNLKISTSQGELLLPRGYTLLIPASIGKYKVLAEFGLAKVINSYVPINKFG